MLMPPVYMLGGGGGGGGGLVAKLSAWHSTKRPADACMPREPHTSIKLFGKTLQDTCALEVSIALLH